MKHLENITLKQFAEFLKLVDREVKAKKQGEEDREAVEAINSHPCSSQYFNIIYPECRREVMRRRGVVTRAN